MADFNHGSYAWRIVVTAVAGGASFALTNLADQDLFIQLALSIFVGGFVLLTQLLHDVENRLDAADLQRERIGSEVVRQTDEVRTVIRAGISELGETTELLSAIMRSGFEPDDLIGLLRGIAELRSGTPLVSAFVSDQVARLGDLVKDIGQGVAEYQGEDRDWLLGFTKNAVASIDAVSLRVVDSQAFWSSELGTRYLTLQKEAIARKVPVRRVFVFDQPPARRSEPGLLRLYAQHADLGIEVRYLLPDAIPATRRNDLRDFIIFDRALCYESTPASHVGNFDGVIQSTRLIVGDQPVKEWRDRFGELWDAARPFVRF